MMQRARVAIAYSGGIDSTVVAYEAVEELGPENVVLIYVDIGLQMHPVIVANMAYHASILGVRTRTECLQLPGCVVRHCRKFQSDPDRNVKKVRDAETGNTLGRLLIYKEYAPGLYTLVWTVVGAAAMAEGCGAVYTGCYYPGEDEEHSLTYTDTDATYIDSLNSLSYTIWGKGAPEFVVPLACMSKADTVQLGRKHNINFDMTHSCDIMPACGVCLECRVRKEVLSA